MSTRTAAPKPDFARPLTSVDIVIFTVREQVLEVLLVKRPGDAAEPFPNRWALPGGFVDVERDFDLPACARRKLEEKAGMAAPYLEQLGSWGGAQRDPRGWSTTHVYFALMPAPPLVPCPQGAAAWHEIESPAIRRLAFDHGEILQAAIERLRSKVEYTSLPAFLLPEPFTLPQLQRTYEIVLGRPVDKSGFRTRMMAAGFLDEVGLLDGESRRPPMGYRLRDRTGPAFFPRTFSPRGGNDD